MMKTLVHGQIRQKRIEPGVKTQLLTQLAYLPLQEVAAVQEIPQLHRQRQAVAVVLAVAGQYYPGVVLPLPFLQLGFCLTKFQT